MKPRRSVERIVEAELLDEEVADESLLSMDNAVSLEELSEAYAKLLTQQDSSSIQHATAPNAVDDHSESDSADADLDELDSIEERGEDGCPVTPTGILEAIFFVGDSENRPFSAVELANMMRGLQASDIPELVAELNEKYRRDGHVLEIVSVDGGFRMQLVSDLDAFRNIVTAKVKETQLNQNAVDCLSLVAYRPGSTCEEIEQIWGRPASSVLSLLVRRELLRIDRQGHGKMAKTHYFPAERFLNLVGIASLDDLPTVDEDY
jgi:segregation and condensation protein B